MVWLNLLNFLNLPKPPPPSGQILQNLRQPRNRCANFVQMLVAFRGVSRVGILPGKRGGAQNRAERRSQFMPRVAAETGAKGARIRAEQLLQGLQFFPQILLSGGVLAHFFFQLTVRGEEATDDLQKLLRSLGLCPGRVVIFDRGHVRSRAFCGAIRADRLLSRLRHDRAKMPLRAARVE